MLPIKIILHPTDFTERSVHALRLACELARDYGARLVVLHVALRPPASGYAADVPAPDADSLSREAKHLLEDLELPEEGLDVERRFAEGDPAAEIVRVCRTVSADIIVMGVHPVAGPRGWLIDSSLAERINAESPCPVLVVSGDLPESWGQGPAGLGLGRPAVSSSEEVVQQASEESFPASDPPAWIHQPRGADV